jgi:hypothetical protein
MGFLGLEMELRNEEQGSMHRCYSSPPQSLNLHPEPDVADRAVAFLAAWPCVSALLSLLPLCSKLQDRSVKYQYSKNITYSSNNLLDLLFV